jgi:hypothetical protein
MIQGGSSETPKSKAATASGTGTGGKDKATTTGSDHKDPRVSKFEEHLESPGS